MSKQRAHKSDIVIIGGGMAGLSLACILSQNGLEVTCIDREDPAAMLKADFDGRTIAISAGSRTVLEDAGIWENIAKDGCAIRDIHISDSGSPVLLEFLSRDVDEDAFGWIFEARVLRRGLVQKAKKIKTLHYKAPASVKSMNVEDDHVYVTTDDGETIEASLLIGADGRRSFVREWAGIQTRQWSYRQQAIVCTVIHDNPHNNIAVEDFRAEGPFAILPMHDDDKGRHRSSVVWSEHDAKKSAMQWSDNTFNAALTSRFPERYGEVQLNGKRFSYPLGLVHAHAYISERTALVADAAHGIHPIAGQGLNLGYRDVACLSGLLIEAKENQQDCGSDQLLQHYQLLRRTDNMSMAAATDGLNALFSNPVTPFRLIRTLGLRAVQKFDPAKRFFMRQAMGK